MKRFNIAKLLVFGSLLLSSCGKNTSVVLKCNFTYYNDVARAFYNQVAMTDDSLNLKTITPIVEEKGYSVKVTGEYNDDFFTNLAFLYSANVDPNNTKFKILDGYHSVGKFNSGSSFGPNIYFEGQEVNILTLYIDRVFKDEIHKNCVSTIIEYDSHIFSFNRTVSEDYDWSITNAYPRELFISPLLLSATNLAYSGSPIRVGYFADYSNSKLNNLTIRMFAPGYSESETLQNQMVCNVSKTEKINIDSPIEFDAPSLSEFYNEIDGKLTSMKTTKKIFVAEWVTKGTLYKVKCGSKYINVFFNNTPSGFGIKPGDKIKLKYLKNTNGEDPKVFYAMNSDQVVKL